MKLEITNEEYQRIEALSYSGLKMLAITPKHFRYWCDNPKEKKSSDLFSAAHVAILEPALYAKKVAVISNLRKKDNQILASKLRSEGVIVINETDAAHIAEMVKNVKENKLANALTTYGANELSYVVEEPDLGFKMKCRPDVIWEKAGIFADLKGFFDLRLKNLENQVKRMRYHWQSAFYQDVLRIELGKVFRPAHIFVESSPPYGVRVVALNEASLDKARETYYPLLPVYRDCLKKNSWPGYPDAIEEITLPDNAWSAEEIDLIQEEELNG